jgi:hypothetical protein
VDGLVCCDAAEKFPRADAVAQSKRQSQQTNRPRILADQAKPMTSAE